ncbi:hypothetical protein QOT17_000676 [Balamuthia mandrillaris]
MTNHLFPLAHCSALPNAMAGAGCPASGTVFAPQEITKPQEFKPPIKAIDLPLLQNPLKSNPFNSTSLLQGELDAVYVVGAKWRDRRWRNAQSLCNRFGSKCKVIPAINSASLNATTVHESIRGGLISCVRYHTLTPLQYFIEELVTGGQGPRQAFLSQPGKIGAALALINALQQWVDTVEHDINNSPTSPLPSRRVLLVFEDDAVPLPHFEEALLRHLHQLPNGWGVLNMYTDGRSRVSPWLLPEPSLATISGSDGVQHKDLAELSYYWARNTANVYSYEGAKTILANLPVDTAFDLFLEHLIRQGVLRAFQSYADALDALHDRSLIGAANRDLGDAFDDPRHPCYDDAAVAVVVARAARLALLYWFAFFAMGFAGLLAFLFMLLRLCSCCMPARRGQQHRRRYRSWRYCWCPSGRATAPKTSTE